LQFEKRNFRALKRATKKGFAQFHKDLKPLRFK